MNIGPIERHIGDWPIVLSFKCHSTPIILIEKIVPYFVVRLHMETTMPIIHTLTAAQVNAQLPELVPLLQVVVEDGAAVGFVSPLSAQDATDYWLEMLPLIEAGIMIILSLEESGRIAGTVQLELATKPNAPHRAEVQKLMIHPDFRRRGLARLLIEAVELRALQLNRTLLVLDTRAGDRAEKLYSGMGYHEAGRIPGYSLGADGVMADKVFFYKYLKTKNGPQ